LLTTKSFLLAFDVTGVRQELDVGGDATTAACLDDFRYQSRSTIAREWFCRGTEEEKTHTNRNGGINEMCQIHALRIQLTIRSKSLINSGINLIKLLAPSSVKLLELGV